MNQIVLALSQPMEPNQVITVGPRRLAIVRSLSREEYEVKRRQNAAIRQKAGRRFEDFVWMASGEDRGKLDPATITHPTRRPAECKYFYEVRELRSATAEDTAS